MKINNIRIYFKELFKSKLPVMINVKKQINNQLNVQLTFRSGLRILMCKLNHKNM